MKITNHCPKYHSPNFGKIKIKKDVYEIITKELSQNEIIRVNEFAQSQKDNPMDIIVEKNVCNYIQAVVNGKVAGYTGHDKTHTILGRKVIEMLSKATKIADKELLKSKEIDEKRKLLKDISIIY